MMLFPYTADLDLYRWPWLTVLVALFCVGNYIAQEQNRELVSARAAQYCAGGPPVAVRIGIDELIGTADSAACQEVMVGLHELLYPEQSIDELLADTPAFGGMSQEYSATYLSERLKRAYREFAATAEPSLDRDLMYWPSTWSPWHMITSAFAHADWSHLIGNLFFFIAFAATVEIVIGTVAFTGVVIGSCLFSGVWDSSIMLALGEDIPTLGLSGVVMTMMGLLAYLLPGANIRCVVWYLIGFFRIGLPVWLLAAWYVGWDVYDLFNTEGFSSTNFLAHVTGAAFGYLVGVFLFAERKQIAHESALEFNRVRRSIALTPGA